MIAPRVVGDAAQVREHAGGFDFAREGAEVAIVDGELRGAVHIGQLGLLGACVPGEQARAGEVQPVEQRRVVRLVGEGDIGAIEQIFEDDRLTEIGEDTAHPSLFARLGSAGKPLPRSTQLLRKGPRNLHGQIERNAG
jgi:hypothetical protein